MEAVEKSAAIAKSRSREQVEHFADLHRADAERIAKERGITVIEAYQSMEIPDSVWEGYQSVRARG